jgi:hypothetical protein
MLSQQLPKGLHIPWEAYGIGWDISFLPADVKDGLRPLNIYLKKPYRRKADFIVLFARNTIHINNSPVEPGTPSFLALFKKWSWIVLVIAAALQIVFWPSWMNLFAIGVVLFIWQLMNVFVLKRRVFNTYPLSSFLVLSFALTQFCIPLIFTLVEQHPITFNMNLPGTVFLHLFLAGLVVIGAHTFYYRNMDHGRFLYNKMQRLLYKVGLFKAPTSRQTWLLGMIGLLAMFYTYFFSSAAVTEDSGTGNKFVQGLIPFTYAPFYAVIKDMFGKKEQLKRSNWISLAIFVVLLFIVSIGRNSRGAFMFGFTGLAFGYFLGLLTGFFSPRLFTKKNIVFASIVFWLVMGPLSDLATAMVIVRSERSNVSRAELIGLTLDKIGDTKALEERRKVLTTKSATGWDERYLDNIFLSRFSNLKYNDASLEMAEKIGKIDPKIREYAINRPMAVLPQPVMSIIGLEIKKSEVNSLSSGDLLFERSGGSNAAGVFRVGHYAGFGMASFGWWYLLLYFILLIPAFYLWDLLSIKTRRSDNKVVIVFSMAGLLSLTSLFQFNAFENVLYIFQFLVRGWIQMVFLYLVLFHLTSIVSGIITKK